MFEDLINKIKSKLDKNNSNLIILRGFPGSGKSTLGIELFKSLGIMYLEPDSFITKGGSYQYTEDNYDDALIKCKTVIYNNLSSCDVCIGDVFPTRLEVVDLIALAVHNKANYMVIDLPKISYKESMTRNIHKVSKKDLSYMYDVWEDWKD